MKTLPEDAAARKALPIATGFVDYFPDAIAAVAELSRIGNDQHNPGKPLHWDRSKSGDESDALMRHFLQRGTIDTDGVRHSAKVAWRAMAMLQKEIEDATYGAVFADHSSALSQLIPSIRYDGEVMPEGVTPDQIIVARYAFREGLVVAPASSIKWHLVMEYAVKS